tara:strand:+ start:286 stop:531 length:246 start_codon:yes stop_codon:yes gene_type:complete
VIFLVSQKKKGKKRDEKKALERHVDFIIRECDLFFLLLVLFSNPAKENSSLRLKKRFERRSARFDETANLVSRRRRRKRAS